MRTSLVVGLAFCLPLLGCPVGHQSPPARAQEAATELNLNTRFGRMELAAEHVSEKARAGFFERRRSWGGRVRVADYELAGLKMRGDTDADVVVRVAWYRVDEGDLHVTLIKQNWHDFKGDWKLVEESRADGDVGLLGETIVVPPTAVAKHAQFPSIRIGGAGPTLEPSEIPPDTEAAKTTTDAATAK